MIVIFFDKLKKFFNQAFIPPACNILMRTRTNSKINLLVDLVSTKPILIAKLGILSMFHFQGVGQVLWILMLM